MRLKFYVVLAIFFWIGPVWADGNLSGRSGLTYLHGTVDHDSVSLMIPGANPEFQLNMLGRYNTFDVTLNTTYHYNDWDKSKFDLFALKFDAERWQFEAGDFFVIDNPLTVNNRLIRGGRLQLGLGSESLKSSKFRLTFLGGESNKPVARGENLEGLYNQKSSISTYRRAQWMAKATYVPSSAFEFNAAYTGGKDLENSIDEDKRSSAALKNNVFQTDARLKLLDNKVTLSTEYAHSQTDSTAAEDGTHDDDTYRAHLQYEDGNLRAWGQWQRIGAKFYTTGYPYLARDRQGPLVGLSYLFPNLMFFSGDYERYDNNLNDALPVTTTTNVANARLRYLKAGFPGVSLNLRLQDERSPAYRDSLKTDRQIVRGSLDISHQIGQAIRGSISYSMQNVDDQSLPDTITVRVNSDEQTLAVNLSLQLTSRLSVSPGLVYNDFEFADLKQSQQILVGYAITEVQIVPNKLRLESDIRYTRAKTESVSDVILIGQFYDNQSYKRIGATHRLRWYFSRAMSFTGVWKLEKHDVDNDNTRDYTGHQFGLEVVKVF